ncbi:hypothetical protein [Lacipirellula sp.]|uniref:hypothetical protein n=1 Tax=Lacipirellula sp. TaxID=2691419 RepID=UPI003D1051F9
MVKYILPASDCTPEENRAALIAGAWTYAAIVCPHKLDQMIMGDVPAVMPVQIPNIMIDSPRALTLAGAVAVVFFQGKLPPDRCVLLEEILQYLPNEHQRHIGYRSDKDFDHVRLMLNDIHQVLKKARGLFEELRRRLLAGESIDAERVREIIDAGKLANQPPPASRRGPRVSNEDHTDR